MNKICNTCSSTLKWLPTPIDQFDAYLSNFFKKGGGVSHIEAIRKNLSYNLQYLQFQSQLLREFKVTTVILTQTWKVYIIVGTGIIEAILYYLLTSKGLNKTNEWTEICKTSNEINIASPGKFKMESAIFRKLSSPEAVEMKFETMIKKVEDKELLGAKHEIYKKLQHLRKLRNKVHLHVVNSNIDTDFWKFNISDIEILKDVLYKFLTSSFFIDKQEGKRLFSFLLE